MYFLVYASSAVELFSDQDLTELLAVSRRNNEKVGVTGLLLYSQGNFMQVLEGPEEAVRTTHTRIAKDPRHTGLITLVQGERDEREFDDWSMGFKRLDNHNTPALPGHSDFMNTRLDAAEFNGNPSRTMALLSFFKKNMR
jgi:hypothetical protein